ncbi:MAG: hypothetical protein AAF801_16425 [Pseudomonadota bacterium]
MTDAEKAILRTRDFWGALCLMALSTFFLWRTSFIPLFGENRAGVSGADWYNSAAIVPLSIWSAMFVLSVVLFVIAIRDGGAQRAFEAAGIGWDCAEAIRIATIGIILTFYIFGLVPRVDFIICSGLLITCLIYGCHGGHQRRMMIAAATMALAGLYALIMHFPQAEWGKPHDDDWVTLTLWIILTIWAVSTAKGPVIRAIPFVAAIVPLILVCAMAFGFRQNVPNRGGLFFSQIEYHYYVTLRPLWRD